MQITIFRPDNSARNTALEIAGPAELVCTTQQDTVTNSERFECPDIECGAVFFYRRVSCGHFVQPDFCPTCGGPMDAAKQGDVIDLLLTAESGQSSRGLILP